MQRLGRDRCGGVAVLVGLVLPVLLGICGLGLDVAYWYLQERRMQQAADVAAFGGARAAQRHSGAFAEVRDAVDNDASVYGFQPEPPIIDTVAQTVRVEIDAPAELFFAGLFLGGAFDIRVRATASWGTGGAPCILALDPSMSRAIDTNSEASIRAIDCEVQANSLSSSALYSNSESYVTADRICVGGGAYTNSGSYHTPAPETCQPIADPLSDLPLPSYSGCDYNDAEYDSTSTTIMPGVYCGGLEITSEADVFMAAGLYVITDDMFMVDSEAELTGNNVTIFMTGSDAVFEFDSEAQVNLTAPTTGTYAGILLFQDPAYGGMHSVDSEATLTSTGAIYLPSGKLEVDSEAQVNTCPMVIANEFEINSEAVLRVRQDDATCQPLFGSAGSGGGLALIE